MIVIGTFLKLFGLGWLILILMICICGGKVIIKIRNPVTKQLDVLTDVEISK